MKCFYTALLLALYFNIFGQHLIVDNPSINLLAEFNGDDGLFLLMKENGIRRGYIGSFGGNPEDVDFGTSALNPTGKVHLTIGGTPKVTLNTAGNLGIGLSNPVEKLHVIGNIRLVNDGDIFGLDQIVGFNDLRFYGDNTDGPDIFIAANGFVGIGTSSPQHNLHIQGGGIQMGNLEFVATPLSFRMRAHVEPQDGAITFHNLDLGNTDHWWRDVYALNFLGPSDLRYKKDIHSLDYGLDAILKMRPVSFLWKRKKEGRRKCGLIAQEVLDVIPEIVHVGRSDSDVKDSPESESSGHYAIAYMDLIPVLIKAIQDQQSIILSQQEEIVLLKDQFAEIMELKEKLLNLETLLVNKSIKDQSQE